MSQINLGAQEAYIFRIVHRRNVPWILENGMHSRSSHVHDPNYYTIGNPELIDRRKSRPVPISPGGTLSDYIPFYFTPYSPMMLNIKTGYGGVTQVPYKEVVIFASSLIKLEKMNRKFLFTDRHAYLVNATFYDRIEDLSLIDWHILKNRDFRRDPEDPGKLERYQAEALIYNQMSIEAFLGLACYNAEVNNWLTDLSNSAGLDLKIVTKPGWYC